MKQFNINVHPCLELINSILLTSRYNEITKEFIGYGLMSEEQNEYTTAIKSFLQPYHCHEIYRMVEAMIPNGFTFSRPVELALCLNGQNNFSFKFQPSDLCIRYCGGMETITTFLAALQQFANETDYFSFFDKAVKFYHPILAEIEKNILAYPFISLLENEYGKEQNSYNYIISSLMIGSFGIEFTDAATQKSDLFSVFSTDNFSLSPAILFHEYSHPFINPLTEKYSDIANQYQDAYESLKKYKLPDFQSGYGDWQECINEHLVRAMAIHLTSKCNLTELADQLRNNDLYRGYKYIPLILERYAFYDNNRNRYTNFESFYPELLKVFANDISDTD